MVVCFYLWMSDFFLERVFHFNRFQRSLKGRLHMAEPMNCSIELGSGLFSRAQSLRCSR